MSKNRAKNLIYLGVAVILTVATAILPLNTPAGASSCDDIKFVFARGSGQNLGSKDFQAFKSSVQEKLKGYGRELKYSFYELGSSSYGGAKYPAVDVDTFAALGAKISAGKGFAFGKSVEQGIAELKAYVSEVGKICKNTKFVLGGYSQGAMVTTSALPELASSKVLYSATFGDPYLYLPEGEGIFPDACRGKNLSSYREFAPDCKTYAGVLGAKKPYQPASWSGKVGLWCNSLDFMCGAGFKLDTSGSSGDMAERIVGNALAAGHLNYASDGHYSSAAEKMMEKIAVAFPTSKSTTKVSNRDTVFLIDRTGSMGTYLELYRKEAKSLAQQIVEGGGRIALYTYGDLADTPEYEGQDVSTPKRILDFGASSAEFAAAYDGIATYGGGDPDESLLSALLEVMNAQEWRPGANKSIVVVTESGFHSPDLDGTTVAQVVQRSLEIDPVNVYVVNTEISAKRYKELAGLTGGAVFTNTRDLGISHLLGRPNVNFPVAEYSAGIGEEIAFSLEVTGEATKYEWDLDFDGVFETATSVPFVSTSYNAARSGYVQAKATNAEGYFSTATALVTVEKSSSALPKLELVDASLSDSGESASIQLLPAENTVATIVSVGGAIYGVTTDTELEIEGLSIESFDELSGALSLSLTPVGTDGRTGEALKLQLFKNAGGEIEITEAKEDETGVDTASGDVGAKDGFTENTTTGVDKTSVETGKMLTEVTSVEAENTNRHSALAPNAGKR